MGIAGTDVTNLTYSAKYPNSPDSNFLVTTGCECPVSVADQFGQRMRGWIQPRTSGSHTFYLSANDSGELRLSSDENPTNAVKIAAVWSALNHCSSRGWVTSGQTNQTSAAQTLVAGKLYYIEALMQDNSGSDNLGVAWRRPGDAVPANSSAPIPNSNLVIQLLPVIITNPASCTVLNSQGTTNFQVALANLYTTNSYQWQRNSNNIANATNAALALTNVTASDHNTYYRCVVTNSFGTTVSLNALLSVLVPPVVTNQPLSQTVGIGSNITFTVAATGTAPLAYQWRFNSVNLMNETNTTLNLNNVQPVNAGPYSVVVTNVAGAITSAVATLTVLSNLTVTTVTPADGSVVSNLNQVTVRFNKSAVGVEAWNLQINGNAATTVSSSDYTNFTFTFSQPQYGTVYMSWDPAQGITDLLGNTFNGGSWQYTLVDTMPPDMAALNPPAGGAVGNLTQLEVNFTEPVLGVDATDLLVNGTAATNFSGTGAGPYYFQFAAPTTGVVQFAWASNHGITDASALHNAFTGGTWNVTFNPAAASGNSTGTVLINELLTANVNINGLKDEDGELQDWIELYNPGTNPVRLLGWSLTDDPDQPGLWTFPDVTLNSGQYLVVYASGKNRKPTGVGTKLHTNFKLNVNGDYLALFNAESPRIALTEFPKKFPEQRNDYSYGLTASNQWRYFSTPTPGAANGSSSITQVLGPVHFSVHRGVFNQPFTVLLTCQTPDVTIRYTTDGTPPTETYGSNYSNGVLVGGTTILRAAAFKSGMLPSRVETHTYIFPANVIAQSNAPAGFPTTTMWSATYGWPSYYQMDPKVVTNPLYSATIQNDLLTLPTLSVVMKTDDMFSTNSGLYTHANNLTLEAGCSLELINVDGSSGFQADASIQMHGGGSRVGTLKHPFRINFRGSYGPSMLEYPFFPGSPVTKYDTLDLRSDYNNHWTHWDVTQRARGQLIRDAWVKDTMWKMGAFSSHASFVHLYINGLYWGVYNPVERPDGSFAAAYFGGDKTDYDAFNGSGAQLVDGDTVARNAMLALNNSGLTNLTQYEKIQTYLNLDQFIDYQILQLFCANLDWGPQKNWYCFRKRQAGEGFYYMAWDGERILEGNNDWANTSPDGLHSNLLYNAEYKLRFGDHLHKHFFNNGSLTTNAVISGYQSLAAKLDRAMVAESARWGDSVPNGKTALNPYPGYTTNTPYTRNENWLGEQTRLLTKYFPVRSDIVLAKFRTLGLYPSNSAPSFSQHGGRVPRGYGLSMMATNTIYYTTNGLDPRVYYSGAIAAAAQAYSNGVPLVINNSMIVKARLLMGTNWSAMNEAAFQVDDLLPQICIAELMYNPPGGDAYEFLELQNRGNTPLDLSGYYFDGITYQFSPGTLLGAGGRLVLASNANTNAFRSRYPGVMVTGWYSGKLANGGERIALFDSGNRMVYAVTFSTTGGWPTAANGTGYSLEIVDPNGDPDDPANWQSSTNLYGTPGVPNAQAAPPLIQLNEVMANNVAAVTNGGTCPDWVELYNPGNKEVNLTNWSLSVDGNPRKFVFPANSTLAGGGYLVVWCDAPTNAAPGLHTGFALSRQGESVMLYDANTNRVDAISFGLQLPDYSIGRVDGTWALTSPTPNAANLAVALAAATNLVNNEYLANSAAGGSDWLELYNRSTNAPVSLQNIFVGRSNALCQLRRLAFLSPGGYVQLFADDVAGVDHLGFKLPAEGGFIVLYDAAGAEVSRVSYGAQIEGVSRGRWPDGNTNDVAFPGSTSPGTTNYVPNYQGPILNEIMASNVGAVTNAVGRITDWIELYNGSSNAWSWDGWSMSVGTMKPGSWVFPSGAMMNPNSYLIIWCDGDRPASTSANPTNLNLGHSLARESGGIYLFNPAAQLMDYVEYGCQPANLSIGRSGGTWRLLANPTPAAANSVPALLGSPANLRLNEWMVAPISGEDWFELFNVADLPVELSGLHPTDDPSLSGQTNFTIAPLSFIGGQDWAVFIADGTPSNGRDHVNFSLDALGESIWLFDTNLALIDVVNFGVQTNGVSQGRWPDGAATIMAFPQSASPGHANYLPLTNALISEVLTRPSFPLENAIELLNTSSVPVNISGWFLSDARSNFKKYRIADGTTLGANGFQVFYEYQFYVTNTLAPLKFDPAHGGELWLSEADTNGLLTGYRSAVIFGVSETGAPFGTYFTSVGVNFTALIKDTFGADNPATVQEFRLGAGKTNAGPRVGPVVINEIMYHPADLGGVDNTLDEYVELYNPGGDSISLFDPAYPTNTWRLQQGVDYSFPTNTTLPADGYLLVVNFNPATDTNQLAAFRAKYGVPANIPIYGPYGGKLDNGGEMIVLTKPDAPLTSGPEIGYVPFIVVDHVTYSDQSPWPATADGGTNGTGNSLQRLLPAGYGNDPVNWKGDVPTPGRTNGIFVPVPPFITLPPQSQSAVVNSNVILQATAAGTRPLYYQWRMNGTNLVAATDNTLLLSNIQPRDAGGYDVVVTNAVGMATSTLAVVTVQLPPTIVGPPTNQTVMIGATVNFRVSAIGTIPLSYQWRFNGVNLANATNALLVLNNVQAVYDGAYTVLITNVAGSVTSSAATLTVLMPPAIASQPANQTAIAGSNVTFTVTASGTAPLVYQWSFHSTNLVNETNATLTLNNVLLVNAGPYSVAVTNVAGSITSAVATLTVLVPPMNIAIVPMQTNFVLAGNPAGFLVSAEGTDLTFRWYMNSNLALVQGMGVAFTNPMVTCTNDGDYYNVVVSNSLNTATSAPCYVLVTDTNIPVFSPELSMMVTNMAKGSNFTVTVSMANNCNQPMFQWYFNSTNRLHVQVAKTLTLTNLSLADTGIYSLAVSNQNGISPTGMVLALTVNYAIFSPVFTNLVGTTNSLSVETEPGRAYWMEVRNNLNRGSWQVIYPGITNVSGAQQLLDTNAASQSRFYRIGTAPVP